MQSSTCGVRLAVAAVFFLPNLLLAADQTNTADQLTQLFETGWKVSLENYSAAQQQYERANQASPGDVRVPYAMALVALKNHHADDARKYLDEALSTGKTLLPLRRTKIWLDIVQKNKDATKSDISDLVRRLSLGDANRPDFQETATWLGKLSAYYKGPGASQLPAADLTALQAEMSDKLKGPLADAWSAGNTQSTKEYAQLQAQLVQANKDAKSRNEAKQAEARQQNQAALAKATEGIAANQQAYEKIKQDYQQQAPSKQNDLDAAQRKYNALDDQKMNVQDALDTEKKKKSDQQNRNFISQLNSQISNLTKSQNDLESSTKDVRAWFKRMAAQDSSMTREINKLQILEQALTRKAKELEKPTTGNDAASLALEDKIGSFTTYVGIDLDQEKKRTLDSFKLK